MRTEARQALSGILVALLSVLLIFGSVVLSLVETGSPLALAPSATATFNLDDIPTLAYLLPGELTLTALAGLPTASPTATPAEFSNCVPPAGWIAVTIQMDDTLQSLALTYGTTAAELRRGNCLPTDTLAPGKWIYVPPPATFTPTPVLPPTATPAPCGPPTGWVIYYVRLGDTLFNLSLVLHVSVYELQRANCMGTSIALYAGQRLYVPFIPVYTPVPTATKLPYITPTPTPTFPPSPTFETPTSPSTQTPTPTPGEATPTPTGTPPTASPTVAPTATPEPPTSTPPALPTSTSTPPTAYPADSTQESAAAD